MHRGNRICSVLTIAGSDNTGGAGIQADIKTCCAFRVYASSVVTAVTVQGWGKEIIINPIPPDIIGAQIDALYVNNRDPEAVKIGMLLNAESVEVVAKSLKKHNARNVVIDPVLRASTGASLTGETSETLEAMKHFLFPLATLLTPNIPEAVRIVGEKMEYGYELAEKLKSVTAAEAILLKGGHSEEDHSTDILYDGEKYYQYCRCRINTPNSHGTGCVLSSSVACGLAKGFSLPRSVRMAKNFISYALSRSRELDFFSDNGPLYLFNK